MDPERLKEYDHKEVNEMIQSEFWFHEAVVKKFLPNFDLQLIKRSSKNLSKRPPLPSLL